MGSSSSERAWLKPRELADRERVALSTISRWVDKELVETKRLAAHTGVRVRMREETDETRPGVKEAGA